MNMLVGAMTRSKFNGQWTLAQIMPLNKKIFQKSSRISVVVIDFIIHYNPYLQGI